ncbi:MAG TPA: zinc ribbon domain-containing protein [Clostridia bacterium]|jgi:hypothetical protein|nr:zinc ribbon domain-containing protein [Clostridia bacterium]
MFFVGIFGAEKKAKIIKEFSNIICPCGALSRMQLYETYLQFHFFFIPLYKGKRKYYLKTRCCQKTYQVPRELLPELLQSEEPDFTHLQTHTAQVQTCPYCGKKL